VANSPLVSAFTNRAGETIGFSHDALGRVILKDLPSTIVQEADVGYAYDNLGRLTSANDSRGRWLGFSYDALGRATQATGTLGTLSYAYDLAGRRTRITHGDGFFADYDHLLTGEVSAIRENGATSGVGVLATYAHDDLGRRTSLTRGNGTVTSYGYDAASRLASLTQDLAGTGGDLTLGFTYNPAGQIVTNTRTNDLYSGRRHHRHSHDAGQPAQPGGELRRHRADLRRQGQPHLGRDAQLRLHGREQADGGAGRQSRLRSAWAALRGRRRRAAAEI
jgi:YD repeat-containing protein